MLAASLPPRSTWYQKPPPPSQRRGRSRNVSTAALARQASEERRRRAVEEAEEMERRRQRRLERQRTAIAHLPPTSSPLSTTVMLPPITTTDLNDSILIAPPTSPALSARSISPTPPPSESSSSASSDNYSRPPSPPRTLTDRIQVAYAHDDIILAKMLLFQLKHGIEVTSPTDPRIDSVKDEDFDEYFVPSGGLKLEEADARMVEEGKRRHKELCEAQKRLERLRACERIWEREKRKMKEEKMRVAKKREEEARCAEARRLEREEAQKQRPRLELAQALVDHQDPGPSTRHDDERPFEYAFMPTSITPPRRAMVSPKKKEVMLPSSSPRNVPFKDVVSSMHGPLFPPDHTEQSERRRSSNHSPQSHSRRRSARHELLDSLVKVVEWDGDERRRVKGKGVEQRARAPKSQSTACAACSASTAPSVSVSSRSSTALSRTSSWLSFGSRVSSTTSVSSAVTTPATSPISSWLKSAAPPSLSAACEKVVAIQPPPHHSCSPKRLTAVSLADCPLGLPDSESKTQVDDSKAESDGALTFKVRGRKSSTLGKRMSLGVSSFVELAKGFQTAYINATLFSVTLASDPYASRAQPRSLSTSRSPPRTVKKQDGGHTNTSTTNRTLKSTGYRVLSSDVGIFTAPTPESLAAAAEVIHFIPMVSLFPSSPLKSRALIPTNMPPFSYRPRDLPPHLVYRMRPISNPVLLRLRALQNVLVERGKEWEGRGREGGLGCGRERVLGVAFEGRGRSGLGCELRVGVF